jgi:hypothetical protein
MAFAKGNKLAGSRKGKPNKLTSSVKTALETAFEELGGVESLVNWGRKNRGDFYHLWVKMLPKDVSMKIDLDDALGKDVRDKLNEVDGEHGGQSG